MVCVVVAVWLLQGELWSRVVVVVVVVGLMLLLVARCLLFRCLHSLGVRQHVRRCCLLLYSQRSPVSRIYDC